MSVSVSPLQLPLSLTEKRCTKCGTPQPLAAFSRNPQRPDGYADWCRECMQEYREEYTARNRDSLRAKGRDYYYANRERILAQMKAERDAARPALEARRAEEKRVRAAERARTAAARKADAAAYQRELRHQRRAAGLCVSCGEPAHTNSKFCEPCRRRNYQLSEGRRLKRMAAGTCRDCNNPPMPAIAASGTPRCEQCYLKSAALKRVGATEHWQALKQMLVDQDYRCAYSGEPIMLGINDSIDHILPTSRFPHLRYTLENVQWVTRKINSMKGDCTDEEFMGIVAHIACHRLNQLH